MCGGKHAFSPQRVDSSLRGYGQAYKMTSDTMGK